MSSSKETLSSNSLFHFTDSAETLVKILENNFQPRYCLEDLTMFKTETDSKDEEDWLEFAIPMVCFCDIPLSKIKNHLEYYGSYGIGLTKEWGIRNGISPLLYVEKDSETAKCLRNMLEEFNKNSSEHQSIHDMGQFALRFLRFTKPYEGDMWRKTGPEKGVRFYDEREWRYVPEMTGTKDLSAWIRKKEFLDTVKKPRLDSKLAKQYPLTFEPDDIKYIIVEKEAQILSIIEAVEDIKDRFDESMIKKMTSRILTKDQIVEDF